jgi:hypothetical protein
MPGHKREEKSDPNCHRATLVQRSKVFHVLPPSGLLFGGKSSDGQNISAALPFGCASFPMAGNSFWTESIASQRPVTMFEFLA